MSDPAERARTAESANATAFSDDPSESLFGRHRWLMLAALLFVVVLGVGLRFLDFTEPPLDYHPTRQLRGAILARGVYYQLLPDADPERRNQAVDLTRTEPQYEPPILESLAAVGYLVVGGERLWVGRLLSILFWLGGASLVYVLARRMTSIDGALVALAYMLLLPLGVEVSRSFQPDAMMVLLLVATAYALLRWSHSGGLRWALAAGVVAGGTILVKGRPAPIVGAMMAFALLGRYGLRRVWRQTEAWAIAIPTLGLPAIYYVGLIGRGTAGLVSTYSTGLMSLLAEPSFYIRWLDFLDGLLYLGFIFIGVASVSLLKGQGRVILFGWWVGYGLYGLVLPYTIYTHDYYNAPLIPLVGLSLAPAAQAVFRRLRQVSWPWQSFALLVAAGALLHQAWIVRSGLLGTDYYAEPAGWRKMGRELPEQGDIVALTHDYGARVVYYGWRRVRLWPSTYDFEFYQLQGRNRGQDFDREFEQRTEGAEYFLVTLMGELDRQPALKEKLYSEFPLLHDGDGYLLFDLEPEEDE